MDKQFIVDEAGKVKSVVLDYKDFQHLEEIALDNTLGSIMSKITDEEEVNLEEAKKELNIEL